MSQPNLLWWAAFLAGNNTWKSRMSTDHDFESHWLGPIWWFHLRLTCMFDRCQTYWDNEAMRCSFTCIDNFRGDGRLSVYLVVKVGVAGEAPHGQVGQWEDYVVITLRLVDQHVLIDIATTIHLCECGGWEGVGGVEGVEVWWRIFI